VAQLLVRLQLTAGETEGTLDVRLAHLCLLHQSTIPLWLQVLCSPHACSSNTQSSGMVTPTGCSCCYSQLIQMRSSKAPQMQKLQHVCPGCWPPTRATR
jgi:hypothetical protein